MKHQKRLALACLAVLMLAACNRSPAPAVEPVAPTTAAAPAAPMPVPAIVAEPTSTGVSSADAPRFDQKTFSGVFTGTLACGDCAGIDTTLELKPDGSYLISETFKGKIGGGKMDGTWTAEAGDRHVRLDPNSKSEPDRLYAIASDDRLDPLGSDGQPAAAGTDQHLSRRR